MDLEEWELLPKNVYKGLDEEDHDEEGMKMNRNTGKSLDMDYFICTTQDPVGKTEIHQMRSSVVVPTQLLGIPVTWEPVSSVDDNTNPGPEFSDLDPKSLPSPRITFKTTKVNEFADMKLDSPSWLPSPPLPQNESKHSESEVEEGRSDLRSKKEVDWDEEGGERLNLWKKGLNGIGAICSFGVAAAAATICVFFLGHNNNIQGCRNKNQILRFQIYSHDHDKEGMMVKHATRLNEVISVMKGLPVARAQISFGGYYDAL